MAVRDLPDGDPACRATCREDELTLDSISRPLGLTRLTLALCIELQEGQGDLLWPTRLVFLCACSGSARDDSRAHVVKKETVLRDKVSLKFKGKK